MSDAVVLDGVSFRYPDAPTPALRNVDLRVAEGRFVLVTGSTGAGKSTLLRTMNGLVPHFSGGTFEGRALVAGRDTLEAAPRDLADVVAFVPQDVAASFVLDRVEDELAYAMENLGVAPVAMRRKIEETLDLLRIEELRARSVRDLSGGERQRVAIAAALTPGARVLLLDEPTSQLDPQGAEDVLAALQRLVHDLGFSVVLAEHRLDRVAGFADAAVACVGDGTVVQGAPRDILERVPNAPPVTRLGRRVGWTPPPLTVRDARVLAASMRLPEVDHAAVCPRADVTLEARGLSTAYGNTLALRAVDVSLARGEVVALVGRNGAGKTTLLRCLAGLHRPGAGTVRFRGRDVSPGRDVALCPQEPDALLFEETVEREVEATLRAHGSPRSPAEILGWFDIGHLAGRHPRDLSAGERLLVAIAAIVATDAPVVLLDEPTRGLDVENKERLAGFLTRFAAEGRAVMLATHDVELVAEIAQRVVMLAAGEVIAVGSPRDVIGDSAVFAPQMARVFGPDWLTVRQVTDGLVVSR